MPIHSLAHDQCWSWDIVLGPLHLPHRLEVGRDGGTAMTRPLQVVEHHHIEGVRMVLYEGREGKWKLPSVANVLYVYIRIHMVLSFVPMPMLCICSMSSL